MYIPLLLGPIPSNQILSYLFPVLCKLSLLWCPLPCCHFSSKVAQPPHIEIGNPYHKCQLQNLAMLCRRYPARNDSKFSSDCYPLHIFFYFIPINSVSSSGIQSASFLCPNILVPISGTSWLISPCPPGSPLSTTFPSFLLSHLVWIRCYFCIFWKHL